MFALPRHAGGYSSFLFGIGRAKCLSGACAWPMQVDTPTMNLLNAVTRFERDVLIERTQSGLKRAKSDGRKIT